MMSKLKNTPFIRAEAEILEKRLEEARRFIQIISGPRQVGKTTMVLQVCERLKRPSHLASADEPGLKDRHWLATQWERARQRAAHSDEAGAVLVIDEIQKISGWSETVKRLWDEDTRNHVPLKSVFLGSSPLMIQTGLTESLAGRFEIIPLRHWSFIEMREAFGFTLEDYVLYGGYPGAAPLREDPDRWRMYVLDALIETTLSRDILLMNRVDKPALLRRLFDIGCQYSGQILSFTKILGQLQDAGNTTTLAHYLDLLHGAGLLSGLQKYAGEVVRKRASSPKFQVQNTALLTAMAGLTTSELRENPELWGRSVETTIGAHMLNSAWKNRDELTYWREGSLEVDFVYSHGNRHLAVEVKSGKKQGNLKGLQAFSERFNADKCLLVGGDGIPLEDFLSQDPAYWLA